VLEVKGLMKSYASIPAIQGVTFSLQPGEVLGCIGPNGSGKSTTVKMLTGLLEPTRGEIIFRGANIRNNLVNYRKNLGYAPEEANLYPYLTGWEYLEMVGILRGMDDARMRKKLEDLLQLFSLHAHRNSVMAAYSKGMRQRILLIASMMDNPDILILDEPLSGLDVTSVLIFKNLVKYLAQHGRALFYCSHVLEIVERVCSHLLILRQGQVIACGPMAEMERQNRLGVGSLENTFSNLVEDVDTEKIARNIVDVISAA